MNDQTKLQQTLDFTAEDLQHNRRGQLSDRQRVRFRRRMRTNLVLTLGGSMVFGLIAVIISRAAVNGNEQVFQLFQLLLLAGAALLLIAFVVQLARMMTSGGEQVAMTEGPVERVMRQTGYQGTEHNRRPIYTYYIGIASVHDQKVYFGVSADAYHGFDDSTAYRVYYTAQSHVLLSAEPIRRITSARAGAEHA